MKQKVTKSLLVLLSLTALTACPTQSRPGNPPVSQLNAPPPVSPNYGVAPITADPNFKSFNCVFGAERQGTKWGLNGTISIPRTESVTYRYSTSPNDRARITLQSIFPLLDLGKFGELGMQFDSVTASKQGADTITVISHGLNKSMRITQSGYAGEDTGFVVNQSSETSYLSMDVYCKGKAQFKGASDIKGKTRFVCKGSTSGADTGNDVIDLDRPLNSIVSGEYFPLSSELNVMWDEKTARITYRAQLAEEAPAVESSSSLLSPSKFTLTDKKYSNTGVQVECRLK